MYLGDCLEIREHLPPVDAVISDPPYGIRYAHTGGGGGMLPRGQSARAKSFNKKNHGIIHGDDKPFDPRPWLSIGTVHVLWGANHYSHLLPQSPVWFTWDKVTVPESYGKFTFSDCELAWTDIKGKTAHGYTSNFGKDAGGQAKATPRENFTRTGSRRN